MSDLNVKGAKLNLLNKDWYLLFTVNVIDKVQEDFDIHINDLKEILDGSKKEFFRNISYLTWILVNEQIEIENDNKTEQQEFLSLPAIKRSISNRNVNQCFDASVSAYT